MGLGESSFATLSTLSVAVVTVVASYYYYLVAQKPKIYTGNRKLENFLKDHVSTVNEKFYPNWFIWEGRMQSIFGLKLRLPNSYKLPYMRELIKLKDGGELAIDILEPDAEKRAQDMLIVFVLPGLTSSSQTCYVKTLVLSIISTGACAIVLNNRGLGGVPLKTSRMYSASNYEDVEEVIAFLMKKYPTERKIAVGTSMGGMVLCKYLAAKPVEAKKTFETALIVSSCWDALSGIANLEKGIINRYVINSGMTQNLQQLARKYKQVLEVRECFDFNKILGCKHLRDFDASFTAPQFGFKSVRDYYLDATIGAVVPQFSIPVFALNSEDDPMAPNHSLPRSQAIVPDSKLVLVTTSRGGHLGYLEGRLPMSKENHYMERFVGDFVQAVLLHGQRELV